jgi:hypothetical protein
VNANVKQVSVGMRNVYGVIGDGRVASYPVDGPGWQLWNILPAPSDGPGAMVAADGDDSLAVISTSDSIFVSTLKTCSVPPLPIKQGPRFDCGCDCC